MNIKEHDERYSPGKLRSTDSLLTTLYERVTKTEGTEQYDAFSSYISGFPTNEKLAQSSNKHRKAAQSMILSNKTFNQKKSYEQLQQQNKRLHQQLAIYQKRNGMIRSYQQQVQYLKKLNLLQTQQIQKLRRSLRNQQYTINSQKQYFHQQVQVKIAKPKQETYEKDKPCLAYSLPKKIKKKKF